MKSRNVRFFGKSKAVSKTTLFETEFLDIKLELMFLRDFYEESDRANRQRWKIRGLIALGFFAYIAFAIFMCSNQRTQEEIEQIIGKSSTLRELDRFCRELPKPKDFKFSYKALGGNSRTSNVSHGYKSDLKFSEVKDFYISYFEKEGWTLEELWNDDRSPLPKLLEYRKGKQTVHLERMVSPNADYSLGCSLHL